MAEWSIASDLKSEELSPVPWVRIPLSLIIENYINEKIMNTLNLYVELMDNYIQLFDFEEFETTKKDYVEILELQSNFWFRSYKKNQKTKARLIIWNHFFKDFELYYWSFLNLFQTKKSSTNLGENYYQFEGQKIVLHGFLSTSNIIDVEKDIFYSEIIRNEEVIIQARKFLLLQRYSNLCQILGLKSN